jgi:beta-glucosidase
MFIAVCVLLVIAVHLPGIPYLGRFGSIFIPPYAPWFILLPLVIESLILWRSAARNRRMAQVLFAVAVFVTAGSSVVLSRIIHIAHSNGVSVNTLDLFKLHTSTTGQDATIRYPDLAAAVKAGKVTAKDLDATVTRVLTIKFRAGLFDHPLVDPDKAAEVVGDRKHGELARKVADEAIILLQNKGNTLRLDAAKIKTLAVIGPNANKKRQGTYSGIPPYSVTVLDGIRQRVGSGVKVVYAEGCRISKPDAAPNFNVLMPYQAPKEEADRKLIKEAVDVASSADVVVLVLGGNEVVSRESIGNMIAGSTPSYGDSDTLDLPGRQNELVREVAKLGKPMVAVLLNGKAYAIEQLAAQVPGILEGWYLGQETGNAVADVLFGDVNPSGHLPVSIARNVGQLPVYHYKTPAARRG